MEDAVNALIATVIVIGSRERVDEAAAALEAVSDQAAVRRVLISEGTSSKADAVDDETTLRIDGLSSEYVDNAVAWLRASSVPAVVWWRSGSPDALERLAHLVDRVVLDTDPPDQMWTTAARLFDCTALTDLHWSALTRWRAALAHLFDVSEVRAAATSYRSVEIEAADGAAARLFAGWLRCCLSWGTAGSVTITGAPAQARTPISRVRLTGDGPALTLRAQPDRTCLEADVEGAGRPRIVPLADASLGARFAEEVSIRTRDAAFERALAAAMEAGA
jgi:glucose-6-phosphate dehydrogenase assembly protein OpcA